MKFVHCIILSLVIFFVNTCSGKNVKEPKFGPYRTILLSSGRCVHPPRPYTQYPSTVFTTEIYNTSRKPNLLRGNITILRELKVSIKTKMYFRENGTWKLLYYFNNAGCNSQWLGPVLIAFGLKVDNQNKCKIAKGVYTFDNVDVNQMEHLFASTREYGYMLWRTVSYDKDKIDVCWESETKIVPEIKKSKQ